MRTVLRRLPPDLLLAPVLLVALGWLGLRSLDFASPVPQSDESHHVVRVLDLERALRHTHGAAERAATWLFSSDPYPNGLYAASMGFIQSDHSMRGARLALIAFGLAHAAVALLLGRVRWGAPAAWVYAIVVFASPVALAFLRVYYLDGPLMAAVGVAVIALEASDGFRRVIPTFVFAVAAVVGMYVKWTWGLFCAVPVAIAVVKALAGPPTWGRRAAWALALGGTAALCGYAVVASGHAWSRFEAPPLLHALPWVVAAGVLAVGWLGVSAWLSWKGRPIPAPANLLAATLVVAGAAGPWYGLVWPALWGRYDHETEAHAARATLGLDVGLDTLRLLVPLGSPLVVVGILLVLARRRGGDVLLGRLVGGALAAWVLIEGLPPDPRYLLPILPLVAGAIVAGWGGLPAWASALFGAAVLLPVALTGPAPLLGRDPLSGLPRQPGIPPAMPIDVRMLSSFPIGTLVPSDAPVTDEQARALVEAIHVVCPGACSIAWTTTGNGPRRFTGREAQALARWAGLDVEVYDLAPGQVAPPGRGGDGSGETRCTVVPPGRRDRVEAHTSPAGWVGDTWSSGPLPGGCAITLVKAAAR